MSALWPVPLSNGKEGRLAIPESDLCLSRLLAGLSVGVSVDASRGCLIG